MSQNIGIITECPQCERETIIYVSYEGYLKWREGELIQRALPDIDYKQREMLISGICPTCWDKMFKGE